MKIKASLLKRMRQKLSAFSLVEATIGMGIVGTTIATLFSGFTSGFFTMQMARENLRATQIMLERVETIRLYSWDQVITPGYIAPTFTAPYDPESPTGQQGLVYNGTIEISDTGLPSSYAADMKKVVVRVNWTTGKLRRSREFTSYISRFGMQDYVY
jgi:type II secretory pathway pseudopilin PulG